MHIQQRKQMNAFAYGKESIHENECIFSQCSCSSLDCKYSGSYKDLFDHYNNYTERKAGRCTLTPKNTLEEFDWGFRFRGGISFEVKMNISDKIVIKRELEMRLLFAVQCFREPYGVFVTVTCIAPSALEVGELSYELSYTVDGHTVMYKSPEVKRSLKVSFQTPLDENFMLIPQSLLRGEKLKMELFIRRKKVGVI